MLIKEFVFLELKIILRGGGILEIGCGAGRVYFYCKNKGFDIQAIETSKNAVDNILKIEPNAKISRESVCSMSFEDSFFDIVFAFGVYHNIENVDDLTKAFKETKRVLKDNGVMVMSVRFHSVENRIIEYIAKKRSKNKFNQFHRWHFNRKDIVDFLGDDMHIIKEYYVRNVSFLFKLNFFRKNIDFNEALARKNGFKLNFIGELIDLVLHKMFPRLFSNLLVIIARKKEVKVGYLK